MIADPSRLEREVRVHKGLRELLLRFSERVTSPFSLASALEPVAPGIRDIVDAAAVEIWLHDRRSRLLTLAASAGGRTPGERVASDDLAHYAAAGLRLEGPAVRDGRIVAPLRAWRRALGTITIEPGAHDDAGGWLEFANDVARPISVAIENVQLFEDVLRQRERLAQSEKLASLGQFVAGIAHEMNNPLQGVLGHLELLIEVTDEARPVRPQLKQIYNEADRAAKIVHNLLVFTGSHRMQRERLPLDRIVSRAVASRSAHLRRSRISVARRKGANVPLVSADPLLLQQALLNVLINAEHAMRGRDGGQIEIETAATPDGGASVTIRDSGPGISPEVLPRIFDPFFTTKEVGQGTGLGLAITYGIVTEHGGTITAHSPREGGAVFRIDLPSATDGGKVTQGPSANDR